MVNGILDLLILNRKVKFIFYLKLIITIFQKMGNRNKIFKKLWQINISKISKLKEKQTLLLLAKGNCFGLNNCWICCCLFSELFWPIQSLCNPSNPVPPVVNAWGRVEVAAKAKVAFGIVELRERWWKLSGGNGMTLWNWCRLFVGRGSDGGIAGQRPSI